MCSEHLIWFLCLYGGCFFLQDVLVLQQFFVLYIIFDVYKCIHFPLVAVYIGFLFVGIVHHYYLTKNRGSMCLVPVLQ